MTHEEATLRTKTALCDALKELMKHKPFSKITVSELIRTCNVNRKTFYYHFEDIYALLKWMLEREAFDVARQFDFLENTDEAFIFVIEYVKKNAFFLNCIYDSVGRDELKRFFYQDFIGLMTGIVQDTEAELQISVTDDFRYFLSNLFTEGLAGMIIDLFQNPDEYKEENLMQYYNIVVNASIPAAIREFDSQQKNRDTSS